MTKASHSPLIDEGNTEQTYWSHFSISGSVESKILNIYLFKKEIFFFNNSLNLTHFDLCSELERLERIRTTRMFD